MSPSAPAARGIAFAPDAATLDAAIAALARDPAGSAVDAETRRAAFARYETLPVPGAKPGRSWWYDYAKLSFAGLNWSSGRATIPTSPLDAAASDDDGPALETASAGGIVHLGATALDAPPGAAADPRVVVSTLADAQRTHPDAVAAARALVERQPDRFAALATAFQNCGAFVYVPAGVVLDAPVQVVFAGATEPAAVFPHVVVVLGEGARATVIERHAGREEAFVCGVVTAFAGPHAHLDYVAVQQADEEARVFMVRLGDVAANGNLRFHLAELGGALVRSVVHSTMDAPGARAEIGALFFNTGMQHVDLATTVDHRAGATFSETVVRTAAADRGQGRFYGNIAIRPKAHGSDASLRDDALLLAKNAHIDSVPALEIAANDVKAFHGATVGSLDEDQLFYASSRGIPRPDAVRMIALAFFEPAIARIPGETLREEIRTALDRTIDEATEVSA